MILQGNRKENVTNAVPGWSLQTYTPDWLGRASCLILMLNILSSVGLAPFRVCHSCLMYSGLTRHNLSWCRLSITSLSLSCDAQLKTISFYHWIISLYIKWDLIIYILPIYLKIFVLRFFLFYSFIYSFFVRSIIPIDKLVCHTPGIFPLLEGSHGFTHSAPLYPESSLFPLSLNLAGLWLALTNRPWHKWHPTLLVTGQGLQKPGNFSFCSLKGPEPLYKISAASLLEKTGQLRHQTWESSILDPQAPVKLSQPAPHGAETSNPHLALLTMQNQNRHDLCCCKPLNFGAIFSASILEVWRKRACEQNSAVNLKRNEVTERTAKSRGKSPKHIWWIDWVGF